MGAPRELDGNRLLGDCDTGAGVEEAAEDLSGPGSFIAVEHLGKHAVDSTPEDGQENIEVDVEGHGGGERIEVEEVDGVAQTVLHQHAPGIASNDRFELGVLVVGEQDGRVLVAKVANQHLSQASLGSPSG